MRVLVVHNRYRSDQPSGENTTVDDEVELLRNAGVTVDTVMTSSDELASRNALGLIGTAARVMWSPASARLVGRAIERTEPDIVHVHNTFPVLSDSVLWSSRRRRVPVVYTLHNFRSLCANAVLLRDGRPCTACVGHSGAAGLVHRCYRDSARATAPIVAANAVHRRLGTQRSCVTRFVAPSSFLKEVYVRAGWPADRIVVRRNGCADRGPGGRQRAGILCISRLSPEKGVEDLLNAWSGCAAERDHVLTIVGDGPERERLEHVARRCRNVHFTGLVAGSVAAEHLATAIALVVPSRCYEVCPRVITEAYAAGTPVIAPALGGLTELVLDGRNGLSAVPGSTASMAWAIDRIAESTGLAAALGAGARRFFDQVLAPETTTADLIGVYEEALGDRSKERALAHA
jgi:glycosyltransferase involved in cell wall biosynthesis